LTLLQWYAFLFEDTPLTAKLGGLGLETSSGQGANIDDDASSTSGEQGILQRNDTD